MAEPARPLCVDVEWTEIFDPATSIVIEPRDIAALLPDVQAFLAAPDPRRAQGSPAEIALQLADMSAALRQDMLVLCQRYCSLLGVDRCRLRLEAIDRQPCWKWHADFVRVRLITSYNGAGTDYLAWPGVDGSTAAQLPVGAIGLFKGHKLSPDHRPCIHRSPAFAPGDPVRLLLVVDEAAHDTLDNA